MSEKADLSRGGRGFTGLVGHMNWLGVCVCLWVLCCVPAWVHAGPYRDSAHGNDISGVERAISGLPLPGAVRGNCVHCHELHASVGGKKSGSTSQLSPANALFVDSFDASRRFKPYRRQDVFCFSCHSATDSLQASLMASGGRDYSALFGGATGGARGTLEVFNQDESGLYGSYHNLYGVWDYARRFPWFAANKTPCAVCHNVHRARNHSSNPTDPAFSSVSRPVAHEKLWGPGVGETMAAFGGNYEPPLYYEGAGFREPGRVMHQGAGYKAIDLVTFCLDCHKDPVGSLNQSRQLAPVDWQRIGGDLDGAGDKHGKNLYTGSADLSAPYLEYASKGGMVLSCADCHEPHGSPNAALVRRAVNGSFLAGTLEGGNNGVSQGYLCRQCHKDDQAFSSSGDPLLVNRWKAVHHEAPDRPYPAGDASGCYSCHEGQAGVILPLGCRNCHFHGSYVDAFRPGSINGKILPAPDGGRRKTF